MASKLDDPTVINQEDWSSGAIWYKMTRRCPRHQHSYCNCNRRWRSLNSACHMSETEDLQQTVSRLKVHVKALERNAQMRSTSLQSLGTKLRTELTEHNEATMRDLRAENAQLRAENEKLNAQMTKMKSKWDSLVQNALNKRKERG